MTDSDSSFIPSSRPEKAKIPWINQPVKLKRIDQLSCEPVKGSSSFNDKDDPLHAYILDLFCQDPITDMTDAGLRGLANNIHFLIMREMYDAVVARRITSNNIQVLYQFDKLKKRHRTLIGIVAIADGEEETADTSFSIAGHWVEHQSRALDSLRKTAENSIYGPD